MTTLNFESINGIFEEFALTNEEMTCVRGGTLDPTPTPVPPPVKI